MPKTWDYTISVPEADAGIEQDQEWVTVDFGDHAEKIRLHDYDRIFSIPGLYERLMGEHLQCHSPRVITGLFRDMLQSAEVDLATLRVLDFGAGNGMVGEELKDMGCPHLLGMDIIAEARDAAMRDRPELYDEYLVADMAQPDDQTAETIQGYGCNALITVAALGFGDIPPRAFVNTFNLVPDGGWVGFNIKDAFLTGDDTTGYESAIHGLVDTALDVHQTQGYRHRYSLRGQPLYYQGILGQKLGEYKI